MTKLDKLYLAMIDYYKGDPKRIQHFVKVHSFARLIAQAEQLDNKTALIVECAAYVHDIGIKVSEEKYGSCSGDLQQKEGPYPAWKMLEEIGFPTDVISRVCFLVAHHHTYDSVDGIDWRILLEADFLVNAFEDGLSDEAKKAGFDKIFETESGKKIFREMFAI
ncbi:MAG: HD domain-containing protein [Acutalibacteraceae bacterium]